MKEFSGLKLNGVGGQRETYGTELLSNPNFATDATNWTLTNGATWVAGQVWLYNGVIATVNMEGAAAGTGYQVDDVLTLIKGDGTGGTVTVATIDGGGGVTSVTRTAQGSAYTAGIATTSGGHGTNCTVNIATVTSSKLSQSVTVPASPHRFRVVMDSGAYVRTTAPGWAQEAYNNESDDEGICPAVETTYACSVELASASNAATVIAKISEVSIKPVTAPGAVFAIYGSDGNEIMTFRNTTGDSGDIIFGDGAAPYRLPAVPNPQYGSSVVAGKNAAAKWMSTAFNWGNVLIGDGVVDNGVQVGGSVVLGPAAAAGSATRYLHQAVVIGDHAAYVYGAINYAVIEGLFAGAYSANLQESVVIGPYSGYQAPKIQDGVSIGPYAGYQANGAHQLFLGCKAGWQVAGDNVLVLSPNEPPALLYGYHDNVGTTGYLYLRGTFYPETTTTYTLGKSDKVWSNAFLTAMTLGGLAVTVGTATPTTGAHTKGDIVINSDPAGAGIAFWQCTTAGTGTDAKWSPCALGAEIP